MTPFALLADLCGLTLEEAAEICRVRPDTARSWSTGRRTAPEGAIKDLAEIWRKVQRASKKRKILDDLTGDATVTVAATDCGLPVGAYRRALALALAQDIAAAQPS